MKAYIPVAPGRADLAALVVRQHWALHPELDITIIANRTTYDLLCARLDGSIGLLDEDEGIQGLSIRDVRSALGAGDTQRGGWYFQQFAKFQVALLHKGSDDYLVWDADTIPLRALRFYEGGKRIFSTKSEYHRPYFDLIDRMLHLRRESETSYISEFMLMNAAMTQQLMAELEAFRPGHPWYLNVLSEIRPEERSLSGFSEYETYGTYVDHHFSGEYCKKEFRILRESARTYGRRLNRFDLMYLASRYDVATFEDHCRPRLRDTFVAKAVSLVHAFSRAILGFNERS